MWCLKNHSNFFRRPVDTANDWNRVACNISANPGDNILQILQGKLLSKLDLIDLIIPEQGLNISSKFYR